MFRRWKPARLSISSWKLEQATLQAKTLFTKQTKALRSVPAMQCNAKARPIPLTYLFILRVKYVSHLNLVDVSLWCARLYFPWEVEICRCWIVQKRHRPWSCWYLLTDHSICVPYLLLWINMIVSQDFVLLAILLLETLNIGSIKVKILSDISGIFWIMRKHFEPLSTELVTNSFIWWKSPKHRYLHILALSGVSQWVPLFGPGCRYLVAHPDHLYLSLWALCLYRWSR